MNSLSDALESFNRKERNLLVRAILGRGGWLPLSGRFRNKVAQKLGLPDIPEDAWWATDYHISWLAGALALFLKGEDRAQKPWLNPTTNGRRLIEGNQEDIDLIIATGRELVLIEAKAYGAWGNKQVASKLARLELLHDFYSKIVATEPLDHAINFHLLLISPRRPTKLTASWPVWACNGQEIPWIELELDNTKSVFDVRRCDDQSERGATGEYWRVNMLSADGRVR